MDFSIRQLIPQREPIMMVDELLSVEDSEAKTCLRVRENNFFLLADGRMSEEGLIEHIAQSASALAGYKALEAGEKEPQIGYIGEVKRFRCYFRPACGDILSTTITMGAQVGGVTIISGVTFMGDKKVAETQMKIYVEHT